jgi:glutathione S-transferase
MKLYYTPNSPYARICRIVAIEGGLADALELDWVPLRDTASPLIAFSPMGRIPVLIEGNIVLSEARHICAYLDEKSGNTTVAPYGDWHAVAAEAQAVAFLDAMTVWSREMRRPESARSSYLLDVAETQLHRQLAHYEATLSVPAGAPAITFETLCIFAAIGMMRFYDLAPRWRETYPKIAAWSDAYDAVPSVAETIPKKDAVRPLTQ